MTQIKRLCESHRFLERPGELPSREFWQTSRSHHASQKVWAVEPSTFDVWAGEDSTATLRTELTVTESGRALRKLLRAGSAREE